MHPHPHPSPAGRARRGHGDRLRRRAGDYDIYVRRTDGSVVPLTRNRVHDTDPAWSPDGGRLAFVRTVGLASEIWGVDADGSDPRRLTRGVRTASGGYSHDRSPTWSPDGLSRDSGPDPCPVRRR